MKSLSTLGAALGVALGVCIAPAARAVVFDVHVTLQAATGGTTILSLSQQSNVQATANDSFALLGDDGGSAIVLAKLEAFASTDGNTRDPFDSPYTVTVKITDDDNPGDATLTFQGRLTGYLAQRQANLINTFDKPVQQATINGNTYTVSIGPFASPAPPIASAPGVLLAYITTAPTGAAVSSVTVGAVTAGRAVTGSVDLNGPAPHGGAVVTLTSSNPATLSLSPTVLIPEGQTSATVYGVAQGSGSGIQVQAKWNNTTAGTTASVTGSLCGDFDGSGSVNMKDVVRLLRAIAGLDTMPNC